VSPSCDSIGAGGQVRGKRLVALRTASGEATGEAADPIVSPFDPSVDEDVTAKKADEGPMELTLENVEKVPFAAPSHAVQASPAAPLLRIWCVLARKVYSDLYFTRLPDTENYSVQVLDTMRPYLMSDGGNVSVADIDGGIVRLKLEGACGTCPSSTMTVRKSTPQRRFDIRGSLTPARSCPS
jgi:hypothetical protein